MAGSDWGEVQDEPRTACASSLQSMTGTCQKVTEALEGAPTGQIWDNMSIKIIIVYH